MKLKTILTGCLFGAVLCAGTALADPTTKFTHLANASDTVGQIAGTVKSCSGSFDLSGTLVHIPGISVSTKLGSQPDFKLLSVPAGEYKLVFEHQGRILNSVPQVTVRGNTKTTLESVTLCPDKDGDGYNWTADFDDANPAIHPDAKEICDRIDNDGDGEVDEGCSYRKCPKGGKFCQNNWNNSNRIIHHAAKSLLPSAMVEVSSNRVTENWKR